MQLDKIALCSLSRLVPLVTAVGDWSKVRCRECLSPPHRPDLSSHQAAYADTRVPGQVCQALSPPGRVRHRRLRVFAHRASTGLGAADQRFPGDVRSPTEHSASGARLWWFLVLSRSSCLLPWRSSPC